MSTIQDLPLEIIAQIFLQGCDSFYGPSWGRAAEQRQLMPFAKLAANVCRDWRDIIHARSGQRFWYAYLSFGPSFNNAWSNRLDIPKAAAEFKHQLESSAGCDIDLYFSIPSEGWSYTQDLKPIERIMIHTFLMLIPYARQIRSMELRSRPIEQLLVAIHSMGRLPRLQYLKLRGSQTKSADNVDSLLSPQFPDIPSMLDLSVAAKCHILTIKHWNIFGRIKTPVNIRKLKLSFCWTHGLEHGHSRWEDIKQLLTAARNIMQLDLSMRVARIGNNVESAQSIVKGSPTIQRVSMPHLKTASLVMTSGTLCLLFSHFTTPSLLSLELSLDDVDSVVYGSRLSVKNMIQLPSLTSFILYISGNAWSETVDDCLLVLLPSQLQKVTLSFAGARHDISPHSQSRPRTSVEHLEIRTKGITHEDWFNVLTRWDAKHLELVDWSFKDDPSFIKKDIQISMDNLLALTLQSSGLTSLRCFLSKICTPALESIAYNTGDKYRINHSDNESSPRILTSGVLHVIKDLEIHHTGSQACPDMCDQLPLSELLGLETLTIGMVISEAGSMLDLLMILHELHGPICSKLTKLVIKLFIYEKPGDEAYRVQKEKTLRAAIDELGSLRVKINASIDIVYNSDVPFFSKPFAR